MSEQKNINESTELTAKGFAQIEGLGFLAADDTEMQGLNFTFDRIHIPAGGATVFGLPGDGGEEVEMLKEIRGVILYNHPAFS